VHKSERPIKRRRIYTSRSRFTADLNDLISLLDIIKAWLLNNTLSIIDSAQPSNDMRNAGGRLISLLLRSGRNTRLLARF
jgi:hypothetical protein